MRPPAHRLLAAATLTSCLAAAGGAPSCTPDIGRDPVPEAMELDPQAHPPRAPQPTSLLINPQTGKIDFRLAGLSVPDDCSTLTGSPPALSRAECEFDQYLQTLDGFPTVTPAQAPATADLGSDTLTAGSNVVVVATRSQSVVSGIATRATEHSLTVLPRPSWKVGELYWVGVRGYDNGVRAANGSRVVGSPTQSLLKQETPLTCGASSPSGLGLDCPTFALLRPSFETDAATATALFQLESIRLGYVAGWDLMNQLGGLPRAEAAVLWSFPIHTASVAELDPTAGLGPRVTAADEIRVAVQGPVDPSTVTPFVVTQQFGSIVVMDLTAAAAGDLRAGFPLVTTSYAGGEIVIKAAAPFVVGHQHGLFFTDQIRDDKGVALVPSPISVLLRLRGSLVDAETGHSTISTVPDSDATLLEAGRDQLATLFDDPSFSGLTGLVRERLIYCFAFALQVAP